MNNNREPWIDPEYAGYAMIILCIGIALALIGWAKSLL
jgi:hypothetical protein